MHSTGRVVKCKSQQKNLETNIHTHVHVNDWDHKLFIKSVKVN